MRAAATGILNVRVNGVMGITILQQLPELRAAIDKNAEVAQHAEGRRLHEAVDRLERELDARVTMIDNQTRTVLSLVRKIAAEPEPLADELVAEVRAAIAADGLWLYEERAWPLFEEALADLRRDPSRELFDEYVIRFDSARPVRERLQAEQQSPSQP